MMFSSKVIKINQDDEEYKSFSLRNLNVAAVKKNKQSLKAAGIYYDLKEEDIHSIKELLQKAKSDADCIIIDAKKEAEKIKAFSHKKGYEEGTAKGLENSEGILKSTVLALKGAVEDIQKKNNNFEVEHQDMLIHLSVAIANKIIQKEITINKEFVIDTITSAVRMTMDREKLIIRVNPEDLEICNQKKINIMKEIDGIKSIEMVPDISVGRGGAIVEYALGEIDARIEKQFQEIETEIIDNL